MVGNAPERLIQELRKAAGSRTPFIVLFTAIVLLRSRVLHGRKNALDSLTSRRLSPAEMAKATQQLYTDGPDGSKKLLIPFRGIIKEVEIKPTPSEVLAEDAQHFPLVSSSHKPNVDKTFLRQLTAILRIAFPTLKSKEMAILLLHTMFLITRTVLSVWVAKLDGRIVRDLVSGDGPGFIRGLGWWFALAVPSTYTNSMLRHLQSKLALRLRTRLTRYVDDLYLSSAPDLRYFRISQPGGLDGVDQYLTSDVAAFCESLAGLYGNIMKPGLDIFIFTTQLARSLGFVGTTLLFANYYATVRILRACTPAFGRLAAVEAMLEGEYRAGMGRIGRNSEEVAFYGGGPRERSILRSAYLRLIKHVNSIYKLRIAYEWTEDFIIKYMWSAAGYGLISIPLMFSGKRTIGVQTASDADIAGAEFGITDDAVANRTENYISSRRLLMSLAEAGGRLMYAYKDILELAGLTTRLYTLLSTLHNLPQPPPFTVTPNSLFLRNVDIVIPGKNQLGEAPLVRGLSVELTAGSGEHLMITGTNGVGKTAVARVLAGLWARGPGREGDAVEIGRPEFGVKGVFVVPQRVYMVNGTLLDQVIYPHSYTQFVNSGRTEEELMQILEAAHLAYIPEREGGWSTKKEWKDVLSGGEKQRMGMARLFYHMPKFAVLDECTSAVSSDVEGSMYEHAKSLGITLITISLRPSLTKYHTQLLTLHGPSTSFDSYAEVSGQQDNETWTLTRVGTAEERMELDREILSLESRLGEVDRWEGRVKELNTLLKVQVHDDDRMV